MAVTAFVLSLVGGLVSFFQGGCVSIGAGLAGDAASEDLMGASGFVIIAAVVAWIGGSLTLAKKGKAGWKVLCAAVVLCVFAGAASEFTDAYVWAVIYGIAAFCAYRSVKDNNAKGADE